MGDHVDVEEIGYNFQMNLTKKNPSNIKFSSKNLTRKNNLKKKNTTCLCLKKYTQIKLNCMVVRNNGWSQIT